MWLYLWLFIWLKAPGSSAEVGTCKAFCLSGPFSISFSVQFVLCYITLSGSSFHPIFVLFLYAFPKLSRNMFHKTWSWCSFLPLCLPSAHWNPMSTTTFSVKPVWHFFSTCYNSYPLMAAHPLLPSSPRMLFVILSYVLSSCSVVLRKTWPSPWVLIPWAYFCVVL